MISILATSRLLLVLLPVWIKLSKFQTSMSSETNSTSKESLTFPGLNNPNGSIASFIVLISFTVPAPNSSTK